MRSVEELLAEWTSNNALTAAAANKIRAYEASRESAAAEVGEPAGTRASALSEVLGYVGGALAVIAVGIILGNLWGELTHPARLGIVAALTAVVIGAGIALWRSESAAAQRLVSVLMVAGVAGVTWIAWLAVRGDHNYRYFQYNDDWSGLAVGVAAVATAVPLYLLRRRAFPLVAAIISVMMLDVMIFESPGVELDTFQWPPLVWSAIGAAVFLMAIRGWLQPQPLAIVLGGLVTLLGLQSASFEGDWRMGILIAGVIVAAALSAYAVFQRGTLTSLVPGAVGLLAFVPQLIGEIFEDALAVWLTVLGVGLLLILAAVMLVRERKAPA